MSQLLGLGLLSLSLLVDPVVQSTAVSAEMLLGSEGPISCFKVYEPGNFNSVELHTGN